MSSHTPRLLRTALLAVAIAAMGALAPLSSRAQVQIDISGDWNATLEGDLVTTCTVRFAQSGSDLSAIINCAGFGTGDFTGAIEPATGAFTLGGTLIAPVEVEGAVSEGHNAISGTWTALGTLSGTFSGIRAEEGLSVIQPEPPTVDLSETQPDSGQQERLGPFDLTGDWNVSFAGFLSGTCVVIIQQSGVDLFAAAECQHVGSGMLSGSIDPATGSFTLSGNLSALPLGLEGTATGDGSSIEGTWIAGGFPGTFTATRQDETPDVIDLSGDWNIRLGPLKDEPVEGLSDACVATIEQSLAKLSATMNCEELGSGTFTGTGHPLSGRLTLHGILGELELELEGSAAEDANSIAGIWYTRARDLVGCFAGRREAKLPDDEQLAACEFLNRQEAAQRGGRPDVVVEERLPVGEAAAFAGSAPSGAARDDGAGTDSRFAIVALAGLAAGLLALAFWRLRLQR